MVMDCEGRLVFGEESASLRDNVKNLISQNNHIVLNLGGVNYIDSGGLGTLVALLHPVHPALVVTEPYDTGPVFNVVIAPDPQVLRADTRLGQHSTGLGEHQAGAAYCSTREVNEVPGVGEAIGAGALAHRGDH